MDDGEKLIDRLNGVLPLRELTPNKPWTTHCADAVARGECYYGPIGDSSRSVAVEIVDVDGYEFYGCKLRVLERGRVSAAFNSSGTGETPVLALEDAVSQLRVHAPKLNLWEQMDDAEWPRS